MKTRVILVTALIALLALPVAVHAQETDPVTVTEGHVEAVNNGDVAAAGEVMAEDAVVTVPQATSGTEGEADADAEAEPEAQTQYTGSAEYQAWLDAQAKANAQTTLGACSVEGERVTCNASYTSDALQAKGVDFVEGELAVTVVEGQIQSYAFIPSAEAVAMLQASASAPETVPVTGGTSEPEVMPVTGGGATQSITYIMALLAVLGLLLAGAASVTRAFQRGAKN
jgi:ketosteroid isomerase-like protein